MAHQSIARLLDSGTRHPTTSELFASVGRDELVNRQGQRRQPVRQALLTAAAVYFRLFVPEDEWQFVGAEVAAGAARLDLVFEHRDGRIRADEIKTGCIDDASTYRTLLAQLDRQLAGGRRTWSDAFVGVRAVLLAAPSQSFVLTPDGAMTALDREPTRV